MSMELWVFSDRQLSSIAGWQAAIDVEGYPLKLSDEMTFETLDGFLPSQLRGELTGFECYHDNAKEVMHANSAINFGHDWKCALGFRWLGSNGKEGLAAWMAGTAYARATSGVVFNDQDGRFRSASESTEVVRNMEAPSSAYDEARRASRRRRGSEA
ncbi:MAG: hypothetical protein WA268_01760 [Xanthobacteraceae bacterium]